MVKTYPLAVADARFSVEAFELVGRFRDGELRIASIGAGRVTIISLPRAGVVDGDGAVSMPAQHIATLIAGLRALQFELMKGGRL